MNKSMLEGEAAVRCLGLSRRYGDVEALKPLDLTIPHGTIFGFLGRNGAGKTTTIRLLTGLAQPTAGEAWVGGVKTTSAKSSARHRFGYLPQEPAFYGWMTPQEFLNYVGDLFGLEKKVKQRRIDEMLDLVGLSEARKRSITGFSGGMMQRLGIAQALLHEPPVLFLDEPTSALDPAGRYELLSLIEQLRGQITVFLSSHILADIERVCDTIGIIREGALLLVAGRDELLNRYTTDVVELTVGQEDHDQLDDLAEALKSHSWVLEATTTAQQLRLQVTEKSVARQALLPLLVEQNVTLEKYEWVRPSLEEIFLALSN